MSLPTREEKEELSSFTQKMGDPSERQTSKVEALESICSEGSIEIGIL